VSHWCPVLATTFLTRSKNNQKTQTGETLICSIWPSIPKILFQHVNN
jgi:hypothetical protein